MVAKLKPPLIYATVPKLLPHGGTVLVLGSGPSLTKADVDFARSRVDAVIAVNDAYKLAPSATALYAADGHWWKWHQGAAAHKSATGVEYPAFTGRFRYSLNRDSWPGVEILRKGSADGLSVDPSTVSLGHNSVYQAVNVAVHFGGTRVLLLGVDMKDGPRHFFGHHPNNSGPPVNECIKLFATMVEPLKKIGVKVINCTPDSALKCFPMQPLREALPALESVAV